MPKVAHDKPRWAPIWQSKYVKTPANAAILSGRGVDSETPLAVDMSLSSNLSVHNPKLANHDVSILLSLVWSNDLRIEARKVVVDIALFRLLGFLVSQALSATELLLYKAGKKGSTMGCS